MGSSVGSGLQVVATQLEVIGAVRRDKADCIIDAEVVLPPGATFRKGILYVVSENAADPANSDDLCYLAQQTMVQSFYSDNAASITSNLRHALDAANEALIEANSRRLPQDRHAVGLTCLVVRGDQAYFAQTPPGQAYIAHQRQLHYYPPLRGARRSRLNLSGDAPADSGGTFALDDGPLALSPTLGLYPDLEPSLYRATLTTGDVIVLASSNLAARLSEDQVERYLIDEDEGRGALHKLYEVARHEGLPGAHALLLTVFGDPADPFLPGELAEPDDAGHIEPRRFAPAIEGVSASISLLAGRLGNRRRADPLLNDDPGPDPWLKREHDSAGLSRPPFLGRRPADTPLFPAEDTPPQEAATLDVADVPPLAEEVAETETQPPDPAPPAADWRNRRPAFLAPDAPPPSRMTELGSSLNRGMRRLGQRFARTEIAPHEEDAPAIAVPEPPADFADHYPVIYRGGAETDENAHFPYPDEVAAPPSLAFDAADPAFGYVPTIADPLDPQSEEWATTPPPVVAKQPGRVGRIVAAAFAPRNRLWLVAVVVVLLVLVVAITFNNAVSAENNRKKQALDYVRAAAAQRAVIEQDATSDPATARQAVADAQTDLDHAALIKPGLPEIAAEQASLTATLAQLYHSVVPSDLKLVKDVAADLGGGPQPTAAPQATTSATRTPQTAAVTAAPAAGGVSLGAAVLDPAGGALDVVDSGSGAVYAVSLSGGPTTTLLKQGDSINNVSVGKPLAITVRLDSVIIVDDRRTAWLYNATGKHWQSFALGGNPTGTPRQIASYGGNLYLLGAQAGGGAILRYTSGSYTSAPTAWLTDSTSGVLDGAASFAIDGTIYVLQSDGKIAQLTQGAVKATYDPASDAALVPSVSGPRFLATSANPDYPNLFVLDGQKRILQFQKNGGFVQQFKTAPAATDFADLRSLVVDDTHNTLYAIDATRIFAFTIPKSIAATPATIAPGNAGTVTPTP